MTSVSENRLKGNYGAAVVMARLSGACLVRPVAADTDVGVDLYCETVIEGHPFLHFWLQVKAGNQCRLDAAKNVASCRFKQDHLKYWERQPVPVFAALVPTDWPARKAPDIYIVDLTTHILFSGTKSASLRSDRHWPAGAQEPVRHFLAEVVPQATARLQVSKGVVASAPTLSPQYVHKIPYVPLSRFKKEIVRQLRTTAANSVLFIAESHAGTEEDNQFRRLMVRIVEQFRDDQHWENFMACALSRHLDGDHAGADEMYEKARSLIEKDPHLRNDPTWQQLLGNIRNLQARAHAGMLPG